jgi:hypothetical protein
MEVCFNLTPCDETGGYVARWDDPEGGGICAQGDSFGDLDQMISPTSRTQLKNRRFSTLLGAENLDITWASSQKCL